MPCLVGRGVGNEAYLFPDCGLAQLFLGQREEENPFLRPTGSAGTGESAKATRIVFSLQPLQ